MKKSRLIVFFYICVISQVTAIDISRYRFHTIPEVNYYHGIMQITKDSIGRMWFNGRDALFMFDGNEFYQMDKNISNLFPKTPWVYKTVFTDSSKKLLVTTDRGLLSFNYTTFLFSLILEGNINSIVQEKDGLIWIIRDDRLESFYYSQNPIVKKCQFQSKNGLFGLSCIKGNIYFGDGEKIYRTNRNMKKPELFTSLNKNIGYLRQMIEYHNDFFVLANYGLYRLDKSGTLKKEYRIAGSNESLRDLKQLYIDFYGILWVATQKGLLLIDPQNDESELLQSRSENIYSLPHNSIWSIYPDPDGGVWIGTFGGKLAYMNFDDNGIKYEGKIGGQLNNSIVSCFQEDRKGNFWIGTEGGGVNYWNIEKNTFTYYTHSTSHSINYDLIKKLSFDKNKENLKIAAYNGGIVELNIRRGKFSNMNLYSPFNHSTQLSVYDFALESDSGIWISSPESNLFYRNVKTGNLNTVALIKTDGTLIDNIGIECLYRDSNKKLWLFSHKGIFVMDVKIRKIEKQYYIQDMPYSANNLVCYTITSKSEIWVGTMGGGLNILTQSGRYLNVNSSQGFSAKTVYSILEDPRTHNIWMSTDDGIYCYDQRNKSYKKNECFDSKLYGSFYPRSSYYTSKGEILFGGTNGFIMFDPKKIGKNRLKPTVYFTDLYINNIKMQAGDKSVLLKDISVINSRLSKNTDELELTYKQSNIKINFSTNSYLNLSKNKFAYCLKGVSNEWQFLPAGQQYVQFFNLPSGSYTLEVKAANNDGIWSNQIAILNFKISPPFWFSVWAYIIYLILIVSITRIIWKFYANKKIFEQQLIHERLKEQETRDLVQLRINFFTNISHDLKTPLMLIANLLKKLGDLQSSKETVSEYIQLMERSVEKIQRMISQLLLFREIESKKIVLKTQQGDLIKYAIEVFTLFKPFAEIRGISTYISTYQKNLFVSFDYDVVEKILFNLFSNAIKYTPEGESVYLNINKADESEIKNIKNTKLNDKILYVSIQIINTGIEIDENEKKLLFKSFSRLSDKIPELGSSSGLGLSIVKELVDALSGIIILDSIDNKVIFKVIIPFSIAEECDTPQAASLNNYMISELKSIGISTDSNAIITKNRRKQYDIVLMEDNSDLREYIEKELSENYNVYVAENGQDGLSLVLKMNPKLVITDLIMPKMDGFEVCKALKSDINISHIPIIMMSAMGTESNKLKGLKDGADIFIEKPFNMSFLLEQVNNLIKSRESLKKRYSKKFVIEPTQLTYSSVDEELLKKAMSFIENNIDNPDYDVESFVSDMGIGRSLLYQKINEITDMSIKEFILDMRLKRSVQLLENTQFIIAEIAYKVGFNDPKYFSVCFKKHYGVSPSDFKNKEK